MSNSIGPFIYFPVAFWDWTQSWPNEMRRAALYFMTSPYRTIEGVVLSPVSRAAAHLRWTPEQVKEAIAFLTEHDFLHFDPMTDTLALKDAVKWQAEGQAEEQDSIPQDSKGSDSDGHR